MKKVLSVIAAISICVSMFCGCSGNAGEMSDSKISELINTAFKQNGELDAVNINSKNKVNYSRDTNSVSTVTTVEKMETSIGNSEKYEMSSEISVEINGNESVSYEEYYKDGFYYTNQYKGNFKTKISIDKLKSGNFGSLTKVGFDDMRTVDVETKAKYTPLNSEPLNDCTVITFECKNKALREYLENSLGSEDRTSSDIEIKSGKGKYVIDGNGYLLYEKLTVTATVNNDGAEATTSVTNEIEYLDIGEDVNPYDPEDDDYTEIDDLGAIAELNSAMSAALTSNELYIDMDISTDILQDETSVGYERDYLRKFSYSTESFIQETNTVYKSEGVKGKNYLSAQYYTDGKYYSNSDIYDQKLYSDIDFSSFVSGIYTTTATTPADIYSPSVMKSLTSEDYKDGKVFTFDLNTASDGGQRFLLMLFGPYEQFGGDVSTAEITVNSFSGKSYLDKNGNYYKTEMSCDIDIKFEEGDVHVAAEQTVNIKDSEQAKDISFPKFKGYEKMDSAELLSAYSGNISFE